MRLNQLYRHQANSTVAFEVIKKFFVMEKQVWKLKVAWWNIGSCHDPWPLMITQKIEIPAKKVSEWLPMAWDERGPAPRMQTL